MKRGTPLDVEALRERIRSGQSSPEASDAIVAQIKPLLAGKPVELQGLVLADCLAIWLAGHQVEGDAEGTRQLRKAILEFHLEQVRDLTTVNARILGTEPGPER
jgi:hypothetical protein